MSPLASTSTSNTRLPMLAASNAVAAAIVLLPTPPLPVKNNSRRSSSSGAGPIIMNRRSRHARRLAPATKSDLATARVGGNLHVRDLVGRDADAPTLGIGEPQNTVAPDRALDRLRHRVDRIVGLHRELARR